jgi:DNA-binding ferritin-like protein
MTSIARTACDTERRSAAQSLQRVLPRLFALSLDIRHAQWNLAGPSALAVRVATAEIGAAVIAWTDEVAELAVALGHPVEARPLIAAAASVPFRTGRVTGSQAIEQLGAHIRTARTTIHQEMGVLSQGRTLAQELLVSVLEGLERSSWMLRTCGD